MSRPTVRVLLLVTALSAMLGCDRDRRSGAPSAPPPPARVIAAPGGLCGEQPDKSVVDCPPTHRCLRLDTFEARCHALAELGQPCQRDSLQSTCAQGSCVPEGADTSVGVCRVTRGDGEGCKTLYECASTSLCVRGVCTAQRPAAGPDAGADTGAKPLMPGAQ